MREHASDKGVVSIDKRLAAFATIGGLAILGALSIILIRSLAERSELRASIALLERQSTRVSAEDERRREGLPGQMAEVSSRLSVASAKDAASLSSSGLTANHGEELAEQQRERIMRHISDTVADSDVNGMIAQQQRTLVSEEFGDLVDFLALSEVEKDYFLRLLTNRKMLQVEFGMQLMTGALSSQEIQEMQLRIADETRAINQDLRAFLNSAADSDYFEYYDRTGVERSAIRKMKSIAAEEGWPVEADVGERLVALISETVQDHDFTISFGTPDAPDFTRFTDANISLHMEEMRGLRNEILDKSRHWLSIDQLPLLDEAYEDYVVAQERNMRAAQRFFNPGP